ncbi:MAG: hypothetical protein IJ456_05190 [Bacteroides sp.]|nr:hypothetical protein [Bacteroides sp.]
MKSILKNLGLILVIVGAVILIAVFLTGSTAVNNNAVLGGSVGLILLGLVLHIVLNKRITD